MFTTPLQLRSAPGAAAENERLIVSEGKLKGERLVAWMRIGLSMARGISMTAIANVPGNVQPEPPLHLSVGLFSYYAFAIGVVLMLRKMTPERWGRSRWPYLITVADVVFMALMSTFDGVDGGWMTEAGGIGVATTLAYAAVRFSYGNLVFSTVLCTAAYLFIAWSNGALRLFTATFVVGSYVGLAALLWFATYEIREMLVGLRRRDNLSRFLPRQIVDRLLAVGPSALAPTEREVTVLFSDIRGFTTLSERLDPRQLLELLDGLLGELSQIVKARAGLVNKFLGDGMLAFWGVPDPDGDHAAHAVEAALEMRARIEALNAVRAAAGEAPIRIGIGIHTGVVAAGMLGGPDQHEYTVIGDAVNVASRVEGLTKTHGVDLLVTERTWQLCAGRFEGRRAGEDRVKGRAEPVVVYAVAGVAAARGEAPRALAIGA